MRVPCKLTVFLLAAAALGVAGAAWACNVPVFRFAIERWRPDPYRAVLFHRGSLSAATSELIQPLHEQQDQGGANLSFRTIDPGELDPNTEEGAADAALFEALGKPDQPTLVVQYPLNLNIPTPLVTGPPDRGAIARLIDSPARRELIKRLAAGQTAVWLLLESGQPDPDGAAATLLEDELKKLEQELELPELTTAPEDAILTSAPLAVGFSLLRVQRDDPAEQALVAMLLGSESDLAERSDPMVFPIYGRGRALWGLIGPGITAKNIRNSAEFLVGPCSCEVKEQNPGFDLLLAADWDKLLTEGGVTLTAAETKITAPPTTEAELVPIPTGAQPAPAAVPPSTIHYEVTEVHSYGVVPMTWIVGGIGALALFGLVIAVVVVAASSQSRRDRSDS
jgi:hypothetical protein